MSIPSLPTVEHDLIHLYLSKHYPEIVQFMRPIIDMKFSAFRDKKISRTKLLLERSFGTKTVDALILIEFDFPQQSQTKAIISHVTLLADLKPRLDRISSTLSQINKYEDLVASFKEHTNSGSIVYPYRRVLKLIITTDGESKFDEMLFDQDIFLVYIPQNIVHEMAPLPKASFKRRDNVLKIKA
jgi:hypothetical protein